MHGAIKKLKQNPIRLVMRGIYKTLIGPIRYRSKEGYNAARYWHDRFVRHGASMQAVGDEGLSERENAEIYAQAGKDFIDLCRQEGIDLASSRVLEIGCGNGFYTRLLQQHGVRDYVGVDITDVLFPKLTRQFPDYRFICQDVSSDKIFGEFDLVLMIDVIEHIVNEDKLGFALANAQRCLSSNACLMVSPVFDQEKHSLFYVRFWSEKDIRRRLPDCLPGATKPFRDSRLLIARKRSI